ncbi:Protein ASP-8 [Aphelenchoides avenae]|nr:Protein ASP-8 [Aphelenchus avenae]
MDGPYPYLSLECRVQVPDFDLGDVRAWYSTDTFDFGAFFTEETPFVVVREVYYPLNPQWPSDGTLGLNDFNQKWSTISTVLSGFDKKEITLFLKSDLHSGGQITFGGKDTQNCGKSWTTFKQRHNGDWAAYVPNLTLGSGQRINFGKNVSLETKSPVLELPLATFRPLVKALGAEYDFASDGYTVNCDKVSSLPSLSIRLRDPLNPTKDAIRYEVPSSKYTLQRKTSSGLKCVLLVAQQNGAPKLGSPFLPPGCIHLDYTNEAVSFENL